MRLIKMILGDIRFQILYGFYFIYAVLSILYICLLSAMPVSWRETAAAILIFSDPAAMGLLFMGAIILLEKSQQVIHSLAVSPVHISEYIASKLISLAFISVIVAVLIAFSAGMNIFDVIVGTILSSVLFSLLGIIMASKISSLNQFIVITIPVMILGFIPPILYLSGYSPWFMRWYPCNCCLALITGISPNGAADGLVVLITIIVVFFIAYKMVKAMFCRLGGAKL